MRLNTGELYFIPPKCPQQIKRVGLPFVSCVSVRTYVCMYVCACVLCMCVHVCVCMYVCMYVCACICVRVCLSACMASCVLCLCLYLPVRSCVHACFRTRACACIFWLCYFFFDINLFFSLSSSYSSLFSLRLLTRHQSPYAHCLRILSSLP